MSAAGSTRCNAASTCCSRACDHAAKSVVVVAVVTLEFPQDAVLQHLHLVLRVLQRGLAVLEQLGAALVLGERALERQPPVLHARDDLLELFERGFEGLRRIGFERLGHGALRLGGRTGKSNAVNGLRSTRTAGGSSAGGRCPYNHHPAKRFPCTPRCTDSRPAISLRSGVGA